MKNITLIFLLFFASTVSCTVVDTELLELVLEIKNQNEELKKQNDALMNEMKAGQEKTDSLINEIKKGGSNQEILLGKVTEQQNQLTQVIKEMGELKALLEKSGTDMELLKSELEELKVKYNEILAKLEELQKINLILNEVTKLKDQLAQMQSSLDSLSSAQSQNLSEINSLKNLISEISNKLTGFTTSVQTIVTQNQTTSESIQKLLSELEKIKSDVKTILEKIESINGGEGDNLTGGTEPSVKDIEGNTYKVVKIGNQIWMAENLKTSKFSNGDQIPNITDRYVWEWNLPNGPNWNPNTMTTTPAFCYYGNDSGMNEVYGKLYNWYVATDPRKICPEGWRVSTDQDWTILQEFIGENPGDKLRKKGTNEWTYPNQSASDQYGFSALPAGTRDNEGFFWGIGTLAGFWAPSSSIAYIRAIGVSGSNLTRTTKSKTNGFCIRCIKN